MLLQNQFHSLAVLATRGVPAVRAALYGARLGAGAAFSKASLSVLGIGVRSTSAAAAPIEAAVGAVGGVPVVRVMGIAGAGVALRLSPIRGVAATVSEELVSVVARSTVRGALAAVGRATLLGAAGGAVIDAAMAGVALAPGLRAGTVDRRDAAREIGKRAIRGAACGAAGVAAAAAVSAGIAATGFTIASAPVVVPIVTMVAASALVARAFDRRFGRALTSRELEA